ncbi:MAG TPA: TonB-dependent receptor [Bryobacterales bacterium]|nr:TonB-dependent receptor [Bryobacterales bacterium]
MRYICVAGGLTALLLLSTGPLWGDLRGNVKDFSGAAVPRARVFLLQTPQPAQTVSADSSGVFRFVNTRTGQCTVFASAPGLSGDKIETPCDRPDALDLVLRPSAVAEAVVVTAERTEVPLSEVGSSVSVISAEDLSDLQAMQLLEAFRYLPGVEVNQTGRRGGVTSLFVRGADSKYNLVTVDGVTINDFGGAYNFTSLPAEEVEQMELVRGPQSALYGSYAIGSAVQVTTPSGLDRHDFFTSAEGGNFGTRRFTAGGGGALHLGPGSLGIYGSLSRLQSDGMVANDDSRFDNAHLKADYQLPRHQHLQYSLLVDSNESGQPGAFGSDPAHLFAGLDAVSRTLESYNIHAFHYDGELGRRVNERLTGAIYSDRLDFHSPFGPAFSRQSREAFSSETSVALTRRDLLIFGMERQGEHFRFDPSPLHRAIYGWFVENHFERGGKFFLNTGVRLEHLRLDAVQAPAFFPRAPFAPSTITQAHPKLSAAYLLLRSTRLHGSAGTGLRPPNGFELEFTTNPALQPERTTSFDAGVEQSLFAHRAAVDVTWFYNRFRDLIVSLAPSQAGLSHWSSDNLANSEASGVEFSLRLQPMRGLRLRGAYTYLDSSVLSLSGASGSVQRSFRLGEQLIRRPRHEGSYLAIWQHRRLLVESGAILRGRTLDLEPNFAASQYLNPFYATFDAGAEWQLDRGVALTAKVRNLLDRAYEESLGFPALGRNFTIGVKWRWTRE